MYYYTALMIGLIGSLHCIGMCGPIAITLPLGHKSRWRRTFGILTYNAGRIFTYGILGALFGLLGQGIEMVGLQQWASILIGVIMILSVIFPALFRGKIKFERFLFGFTGKQISIFRKLFAISTLQSLFLIGLLNGLLPCGLVYVAVAGALDTNNIFNGIVFMLIFGFGTLPVMLTIPLIGNIIGTGIRKRFKYLLLTIVVILGVLFILRGLALGIPYLSPQQNMLKPHKKIIMRNNKDQEMENTMILRN